MAARRGWEQLSAKYRSRLVKGGMTKERYETGESLKAARGHSTTPENRRDLEKNPERYKEYRERRKGLVDRIVLKKKKAFEYTTRWNEENSKNFVRNPVQMTKRLDIEIKRPTMAQLRMMDAMDLERFIEWQYKYWQDDDWKFLWYH